MEQPIRASEALSLGASLTAPVHGQYLEFTEGGREVCAACALGSILVAVGELEPVSRGAHLGNPVHAAIIRRWPWMALRVACPAEWDEAPHCDWPTSRASVVATAEHLFEWHRWTREAVAAWLAGQERQAEVEGADIRQAAVSTQ